MFVKVIKNKGKYELYNAPRDVMPGGSAKLFYFKKDVIGTMNSTGSHLVEYDDIKLDRIEKEKGKDIYVYKIICG